MFSWEGNRFSDIKPFLSQSRTKRKKVTYIFIIKLLCGASKAFMKAFKAFIKPFETPQGKGENKNLNQFFFFVRDWGGKG